MKYIQVILLSAFFSGFFLSIAIGQTGYSFNFNIENGLPSNHVYGVITDKHGYLWVATEKGVARYNGYDFRIFNLSDGLPTDDIWELNEDKKGKIWLSNISDEYGYLYNNQYHKAVVNWPHNTIYPQGVKVSENGIVFISYYLHGDGQPSVCFERNDTIYSLTKSKIDRSIDSNSVGNVLSKLILINNEGQSFFQYSKNIYKIIAGGGGFASTQVLQPDSTIASMLENNQSKVLGMYVILYSVNSDQVIVKNVNNNETEKVNLTGYGMAGKIQYAEVDVQNKMYYVVSDKSILQFKVNHGIKYQNTYAVNQLIPENNIDGSKIHTILWSNFWGKCICTENSGLWINRDVGNKFKREDKFDIHEYKFVGGLEDSICFLWNKSTHSLAIINKMFQIENYHYNEVQNIKNVIHYNADTFLLTGSDSYFFINKHKKLIKINKDGIGGDMYSAILEKKEKIYLIGRPGFYYIDLQSKGWDRHFMNFDRYYYFVYDSLRQSYWVYNNYKIFIHATNKDSIITSEHLSHFGIQKISKIIVDNKFGNIFFKGPNSITVYDPEKNTYQELFKEINLKESSIFIYHNLLIVTGQFGILFSKILGKQQISEPLVFPNLKNANYNNIYDCEASFGKLFLNTDKGTYEVTIPTDSEILNSKPDSLPFNYKFILNYRDTINDFRSGDTIIINQNFRRVQFDIINPFGNGRLKYAYQFSNDSAWHELNANELTLSPKFRPGNYYSLYLKVHDNVWRSDKTIIYIYIQPYWWQTIAGQRIIWALTVLGIIILLTISVLVTRRLVLESAKKRSLRMELELKAIYSQINPHFIFNTLNSALLLVKKNKMEEAYTHISTFSRLLRGYLKSSRNKLITIAEEINNLRDYIELQQTRFKNKFEYELKVESIIEQKKIMIPSLLIQPFVENAINHGILPQKEMGHLKIEFKMSEEKNRIICTIEDNGVGRRQSKVINENKDDKDGSYGDLLIKELVNIFNKYENMNIDIKYTDKEEINTGTLVTIQIKNLQYA